MLRAKKKENRCCFEAYSKAVTFHTHELIWVLFSLSTLYFNLNFLCESSRSSDDRMFFDANVDWYMFFRFWLGKLGERTGQLWRDNSRRVRTHEKNSKETVRRLGTIIQSIFVPNQEPAFAWPFGNGPVKVGTQGLSRPDNWKLSSRHFSRPDWLPMGLQGWGGGGGGGGWAGKNEGRTTSTSGHSEERGGGHW